VQGAASDQVKMRLADRGMRVVVSVVHGLLRVALAS
jgi:hypothetical protein